jgi:aldehyde dehydrogenase (NAD+)
MQLEMGAPTAWSRDAQAWAGQVHIEATIKAAEEMQWEVMRGNTRIIHEGIGVCVLITPWNWPMNQIACKVAPALIAGCTMVLKPSEIAPLSGALFAEICHEAGVPPGVFNLINGTGPEVGAHLAAHPQVDMVSFTGSTRAGTAVAAAAAPTVKRVAQELGGKSPNIVLPSADLAAAVRGGVEGCFGNTGQSCDAPTRMFVPRDRAEEAYAIAARVAAEVVVGDPTDPAVTMGPLISKTQFDKVQGLIQQGMDEGARLIAGGLGRPAGLNRGWFAQPTIFGEVTDAMTIAREEIFGPVLSILPYDTVDQAVASANDTVYGLAAYVQGDPSEARAVGRRLRAGQVNLNYPDWDTFAPFGGYKQSGNGREYADWGIHDFCEVKAIVGYGA